MKVTPYDGIPGYHTVQCGVRRSFTQMLFNLSPSIVVDLSSLSSFYMLSQCFHKVHALEHVLLYLTKIVFVRICTCFTLIAWKLGKRMNMTGYVTDAMVHCASYRYY